VSDFLGDLYTLEGGSDESKEDFVEKIYAQCAEEHSEDVDTGIEIPDVPGQCNELKPTIGNALDNLVSFAGSLQECFNQRECSYSKLETACEVPTAEV
jgi:hypothetical protein